jgi:hypothetical protein
MENASYAGLRRKLSFGFLILLLGSARIGVKVDDSRQRSNIPAYMTVEVLREELRSRNYTLIVSGDNYIAISHEKPIAIFR